MQALCMFGAGYCLLFWDDSKPERVSRTAKPKPTAISLDELVGAGQFPPSFNAPDFKDAWDRWIAYKKEIRKKMTATTAKMQAKTLSKMGKALAIESIDQSIRNGWQGIFDVKGQQWKSIPATEYNQRDIADRKALEEALR